MWAKLVATSSKRLEAVIQQSIQQRLWILLFTWFLSSAKILKKKIKKKIVCCLWKSNQRVTDRKTGSAVNSFWITCVWKKNSSDVHTHCFRPGQVFCVVTSLVCFEHALPPQVSGFIIRWRHISTLFSSLKIEKPCVGNDWSLFIFYSKHGISYITCIIFCLSCCCWCCWRWCCFLIRKHQQIQK